MTVWSSTYIILWVNLVAQAAGAWLVLVIISGSFAPWQLRSSQVAKDGLIDM